jgi:two-component system sensor histidine kinase/response regulator
LSPAVEESSAGLGHRLRTPLTHIIGYSALLIEADSSSPEAVARLETVNAQAEIILRRIEHWLAPSADGGGSGERIAALRAGMAEPLSVIVRNVGTLLGESDGPAQLDVLRIARACTELVAFTQQETGTLRPASATRPVTTPRAISAPMPANPPRILVVDDNPGNRDMLDRQLGRYGYSTVCVETGAACLDALRQERIDLVLLDVMMPGVSGVELLEQIKQQSLLASIPVIMISALDEVESAAQCIELGAEDYLLKPFDPVLLRARLHSALERKRLQEEQRERTRELEKATEDLQRANDDLQSFASVASHDLQEPLRTITTTLQLFALQSGENLTSQQRDLVSMAVEGGKRMSRLISGLLAYSLSGSTEMNLGEVDCEAALLEAITNLREAIRDSGAQITHGALPVVMAHPGCLVQLFQNLVGNAIKYRSDAKPEIRITAEREGSEWVVSVEDNGIGIEEQYRRKIFQPFGRLHGHDRPGTGLGLAICERILRKSGGRIWVDSEPGAGSVFHFTAHGTPNEERAHL